MNKHALLLENTALKKRLVEEKMRLVEAELRRKQAEEERDKLRNTYEKIYVEYERLRRQLFAQKAEKAPKNDARDDWDRLHRFAF